MNDIQTGSVINYFCNDQELCSIKNKMLGWKVNKKVWIILSKLCSNKIEGKLEKI